MALKIDLKKLESAQKNDLDTNGGRCKTTAIKGGAQIGVQKQAPVSMFFFPHNTASNVQKCCDGGGYSMSPRTMGDSLDHKQNNWWIKLGIAALATALYYLLSIESAAAYEPWWVQNHRETDLWSGLDGQAKSFQKIAQWNYFKVVAPQGDKERLYVWNPKTNNYAYINARDVGPSGPPPKELASFDNNEQGQIKTTATEEKKNGSDTNLRKNENTEKNEELAKGAARSEPKLEDGYQGWWVANFRETKLWKGPKAEDPSICDIPQFRKFLVVAPQNGDRLKVWYPEKDEIGYIEAKIAGPTDKSVWIKTHPIKEEKNIQSQGRSIGDKTYVRNLPVYDDETEVRKLPNNSPITIKKSITTSDGTEWYVVEDGEYILASEVRIPRTPERYLEGKWIDADLDEPAMVTAYEGNKVVMTTLAIKGVNKYPTPQGSFSILRRVANETMDSETIGIPRDAPGGYMLKNVLYTQYFTNDGASLHYNYWAGTFGYPGSHGCLGLTLEDSKWLWDWASVGTPVIVRSAGAKKMVQTGSADR